RCGQEHALREVDAPHHLVLRVCEPQQHLVVREREPVRVEEIRVQLTRDRGVCPQEGHPGFEAGGGLGGGAFSTKWCSPPRPPTATTYARSRPKPTAPAISCSRRATRSSELPSIEAKRPSPRFRSTMPAWSAGPPSQLKIAMSPAAGLAAHCRVSRSHRSSVG